MSESDAIDIEPESLQQSESTSEIPQAESKEDVKVESSAKPEASLRSHFLENYC